MGFKKLNRRKLLIGVAVAITAVGVGGGVAFAVWSVNGSGSGAGAATVAQGVTLTAVTPTGPAASLYPGGPAGSVYFQVANPNPYAITITNITWGTPVSANPTACPNSNISLDANAPKTGLTINVPAGATAATFSEPNVLDLLHSAPDGCQGVAFNVSMTVSGVQQ
jgi:hypothetical protein